MSSTTILIVEDQLIIAEGLAKDLENLGYKVTDIVASGQKALQSIAKKAPDLVLMDIVIKGEIDGIETAGIIAEEYNLPIIYITSYADEETLERAKKTNPFGYIVKPFKEKELRAVIEIALNKYQEQMSVIRALDISENLNQQQSHYISMMSHELRTPLTTIQMAMRMLQEYESQLTDFKKAQYFGKIQSAIHNLNSMIDDFLVLSQAESGKLNLDSSPVNLESFCKHLLEEFDYIIGDKHQLIFLYESKYSSFCLDEKQLHYILNNLLSNAIKYSPQGGEIYLKVYCESQYVCFSVEDQGIGIPLEYQDKLFDRFERANNVGKIRGTGLGLAIVKQIVDCHEGTITVDSQLGIGTKVTVTLPLILAPTLTHSSVKVETAS